MTEAVVEAPASTEKKKKETPPVALLGMVAYVDAGARPNPGHGGVGMHAYVYSTASALKGVGLGNQVASTHGYVAKEQTTTLWGKERTKEEMALALKSGKVYQVVPQLYIDYFRSVPSPVTNNMLEIEATIHAMDEAMKREVSHLQIYSDSEMTCKAMNGWIDRWAANNWCRPDGTPIKNPEIWKRAKQAMSALNALSISFKIDWVRSHNGDLGNELSDILATMGVFQSQQGREVNKEVISSGEGYWKMQIERHPFMASPKLYFNTLAGASIPGTYYLGHHGKDDDQVGTRDSESHYSIVRLANPIPVLETVRRHQEEISHSADSIFQMYVDRVFNPDMFRFLNSHETVAIEPTAGYRDDLTFVNGPLLTKQFKPSLLSRRVVDAMTHLDGVLEQYLNDDSYLQVVDLTDYLYDKEVKPMKGKKGEPDYETVEYTLKKDLGVGTPALDVTIPHPFQSGQTYDLTLTIGTDLLERNSLKRLEGSKPKVSLVIWHESNQAFRFATIIEAGDDVGIWSAGASNLRLIPAVAVETPAGEPKKSKKK
jgi:ribonuclease HI